MVHNVDQAGQDMDLVGHDLGLVGLHMDLVGMHMDLVGHDLGLVGLHMDLVGMHMDLVGHDLGLVGLYMDPVGLYIDLVGLHMDLVGRDKVQGKVEGLLLWLRHTWRHLQHVQRRLTNIVQGKARAALDAAHMAVVGVHTVVEVEQGMVVAVQNGCNDGGHDHDHHDGDGGGDVLRSIIKPYLTQSFIIQAYSCIRSPCNKVLLYVKIQKARSRINAIVDPEALVLVHGVDLVVQNVARVGLDEVLVAHNVARVGLGEVLVAHNVAPVGLDEVLVAHNVARVGLDEVLEVQNEGLMLTNQGRVPADVAGTWPFYNVWFTCQLSTFTA
ncbi:hypothetical protein CAPTEDRAFT_194509 [Capitella teleta]|uniref:Uncharacterized protein n=1 Tax=Capitella teleta TaxID=283909 RepID=R7T6Z2_CAPTE|nr:hypothetical protein CAPTEDRAFT_194509 [Capitella teleta]|eukprot:ELT89168.1 hypothetical protein CAPTEDRAFT_194509 [Capitella teleta]